MRMTDQIFCKVVKAIVIFMCLYMAFYHPAYADDGAIAKKSAQEILTLVHNGQSEQIYDKKTSDFLKSKLTKNTFIANLKLAKQQTGKAKSSQFIDVNYSQYDPASGYVGEIYAFRYLTTFQIGKFYEIIVVVKESDGVFRLSGIWGYPAQ